MILLRNLIYKGIFDGVVTLEILNATDGATLKMVNVTVGASLSGDEKIMMDYGAYTVDLISVRDGALVVSIFNDD